MTRASIAPAAAASAKRNATVAPADAEPHGATLKVTSNGGHKSSNDSNGGALNKVDSKAAFDAQWKNRSQYLAKLRAFDNRMRQQGYLTKDGQELFAARAGLVLDRIGVR